MSKKNQLMKVAITNLLKELGRNIPEDKLPEVEKKIKSDLAKKLGSNWTNLPFTGPYMLVTFIIFNYTLLPLGISPGTIADTVIQKTKELNLDEKSRKLLVNAKEGIKSSGEYTTERLDDIGYYLSSLKDHNFAESLKYELDETKKLFVKGLEGGKSILGKFGKKIKNSKSEQD